MEVDNKIRLEGCRLSRQNSGSEKRKSGQNAVCCIGRNIVEKAAEFYGTF